MTSRFLHIIQQFLAALESTQGSLLKLYAKKRDALVASRADVLEKLSQDEVAVAQRLQTLLEQRQVILKHATQAQLPSDSIAALVVAFPEEQARLLSQAVERCRTQASQLQFESWSHWVIAHRAHAYCTEMLDLIASGGTKSATYSRYLQSQETGGTILDASA